MKTHPLIILSICGIIIMVLLSEGCREQAVADDFEAALRTTYQNIGLTKIGLDYPSQEALEICKQHRAGCEKDYSRNYVIVQNAKKELLAAISANPKRALAFTLDTMCRQCDKNTERLRKENEVAAFDVSLECLGAITALYYFDQDDQNQIIMDRLTKPVPQVLMWLTRFQFEWIYNRPHPQRWIEALEKIPDNQLKRDLKATIIEDFKEAGHHTEKFGVMLGDSGTGQ